MSSAAEIRKPHKTKVQYFTRLLNIYILPLGCLVAYRIMVVVVPVSSVDRLNKLGIGGLSPMIGDSPPILSIHTITDSFFQPMVVWIAKPDLETILKLWENAAALLGINHGKQQSSSKGNRRRRSTRTVFEDKASS